MKLLGRAIRFIVIAAFAAVLVAAPAAAQDVELPVERPDPREFGGVFTVDRLTGFEVVILVGSEDQGGEAFGLELATAWRRAGYRPHVIVGPQVQQLDVTLSAIGADYRSAPQLSLRHVVTHFYGHTSDHGRALFFSEREEPTAVIPYYGPFRRPSTSYTNRVALDSLGTLLGSAFPVAEPHFVGTRFSTLVEGCNAWAGASPHLAALRAARGGTTLRGFYSPTVVPTDEQILRDGCTNLAGTVGLSGVYSRKLPAAVTKPGFATVHAAHSSAASEAKADAHRTGAGYSLTRSD